MPLKQKVLKNMNVRKIVSVVLCFVCSWVGLGQNILASEVLTEPEITAPSAVLIDAKTGVIIFEKEKDQQNYPASITKLMTALLTLEYAKSGTDNKMQERVAFSHEAVFSVEFGSSHIAMDEGETLTIEESLYAIMLASANEVSNALAEHISGSVNEFAELMTKRAKELGAKNSNFVNPHGLHDENHYTTAYDMALIMKQAVTYPEFNKIINTYRYDIPPTEKQSEARIMHNTHRMIRPGYLYFNEDVVGGKTGYTSEAKHTLVTFAKQGEKQLIAVVMHDEKEAAYTDTQKMFEYGFSQFKSQMILDSTAFKKEIPIMDNNQKGSNQVGVVYAVPSESLSEMLPPFDSKKITTEVDLPKEITHSVIAGDVLGKVTVLYDGIEIGKTNLVAENNIQYDELILVENNQSSFTVRNILLSCGVVLLGFIAFVSVLRMKKKRRRTVRYGLRKARKKSYRYRN